MELVIGLLWIMVYIAVIAAAVYLFEWFIKSLFPNAPERVFQMLWVVAILIALILVIQWLVGVVPLQPPLRR